MKYLEIREGVFLNTDSVEVIESVDALSSRVITSSSSIHLVNFPAETLVQLLSMEEPHEPQTVKLEPAAQNALNSLGHHYAG